MYALLDSLYRGYPSGAILLWETEDDVPLQEFAVAQEANPYKTTRLLLDGQQRLTSLSAIIRGEPVLVRGRKRPIEILFNLEHPDSLVEVTEVDDDESDEDLDENGADITEDELRKRFERMTFVISTKQLEQDPKWVKVTDVFKTQEDSQFLRAAGITGLDDPRYTKYSQRLGKLRTIAKYVYRLDILDRSLSYDEVTEIFVRVNSLGAKLRSSDLALAQITAKWRGSLATFQQFQGECAAQGFDFDLGTHLKSLVAIATGQSRFLTVGNLSRGRLEESWRQSSAAIDFALNFLRSNTRIDSPALLSSPFLVIALGYFGHAKGYDIGTEEAKLLRKWVLLANAKGHYSRGSTETVLDQDLSVLRGGGGVAELIERLRLHVGRLDVQEEELEGRSMRSALFKSMFLAFRERGATDWKSQLEIAIKHSGVQHRLQFHHIFPKALLKDSYATREINDVANLVFIGGKTNRQLGDKPPESYLPPLISKVGTTPFEAQCIPLADPDLLRKENYLPFLAARRELIAKRLNEFLGA